MPFSFTFILIQFYHGSKLVGSRRCRRALARPVQSGSTNWFRGHFHTIKCSSRSYRVDVYIAELAPTGEHGAKIPAPGTRNIFEQPADVHTKQADNVISTVVFIFETCYRMSNTPLAWSSKWCYGGYLKAHASADAHDRKLCSTLKVYWEQRTKDGFFFGQLRSNRPWLWHRGIHGTWWSRDSHIELLMESLD